MHKTVVDLSVVPGLQILASFAPVKRQGSMAKETPWSIAYKQFYVVHFLGLFAAGVWGAPRPAELAYNVRILIFPTRSSSYWYITMYRSRSPETDLLCVAHHTCGIRFKLRRLRPVRRSVPRIR